jgi:MoaA/NifB/PqqE/SkfB family radical SAM enzyme
VADDPCWLNDDQIPERGIRIANRDGSERRELARAEQTVVDQPAQATGDGPTGIAPVLQVHPSLRCNIACAHCYSSSGPIAREELPMELLSPCLEDAAALGYRQLAVSGGEPLMYKPLPQLLAAAREAGMITTVTSNGMLATRKVWERIAPLVSVAAISIDGTQSEHDAIRCQEGAFARTVANLPVLRASGVPFGFIFTLTQHNVDSLAFVVRLAAEHGARSVQVHPLTMQGRATIAMKGGRPDSIEMAFALFEASKLGKEHGVVVRVDAVTAAQIAAHRNRLVPERPVRRLVDVAPVLIVNANATVVPLTHDVSPALRLGSLADGRLAALSAEWIANGRADALASACEHAWDDLTRGTPADPVYWYDAVAVRTRPRIAVRTIPLACS